MSFLPSAKRDSKEGRIEEAVRKMEELKPCGVSLSRSHNGSYSTRVNYRLHHMDFSHLVMHDCGPELSDKVAHFSRIFWTVNESCHLFLFQ